MIASVFFRFCKYITIISCRFRFLLVIRTLYLFPSKLAWVRMLRLCLLYCVVFIGSGSIT
uniref:Uncharacterized protein n=1 Tax=Arundo donax TaxID=35708 RepID=A0A0A8ZLG9_ARUDO